MPPSPPTPPTTPPNPPVPNSQPAPPSPPSSSKALLWLCLGVALLAAALYFLVGDAWLRWFPRE